MTDSQLILRCIDLARNSQYYVAPNPMVGAVLTDKEGKIISEGWHMRYGGPHAEVNCLRHISDGSGCTLYVNLEPCSHFGKTPPCADLIISKHIRRVVCGMLDPNPLVAGNGVKKLRDAGIEVLVGVEEKACRQLNKRFLMLQEHKRPYIILKWAQTADGFIDMSREAKSGKPLVLSNELTKQIVHKMRAENMAIMVGTNTVLQDNPRLWTTRWPGRSPIRVTIDRHNRLPQDARIFDRSKTDYAPLPPYIVYRDQTDWPYIVEDLGEKGIHSILVEGGATLLNHILGTGLYDEVHVEVAPICIGTGVKGPEYTLPDTYTDCIDGAKIYEVYR